MLESTARSSNPCSSSLDEVRCGRGFGKSRHRIKFATLFGELLMIHCLPPKIFDYDMFLLMLLVLCVLSRPNHWCTVCGYVIMPKMYGNLTFALPGITRSNIGTLLSYWARWCDRGRCFTLLCFLPFLGVCGRGVIVWELISQPGRWRKLEIELELLVQEYFDACQFASGPSVPVRWTCPPDGLYKVNFDATLFEGSGCAGIGVAILDSSL